jgi:hypothetical protein
MITRIFNKSKPINFVIVIIITFLAFVFVNIKEVNDAFSILFLVERLVLLLISIFSIFLLNFIVVKNKLLNQSNYHILLFSLFLALLPITLLSFKILLSNVFILFALRRLISLRTQKNTKKKLFDASLWIGIATIFYFWAILFFVLIFIALFLYSDNKIKDWIISFTGILTVLLLSICYNLVVYNNLESLYSHLPNFNFELNNYNSIPLIASITIILSFSLWSTIFYIRVIKSKLKVFKPPHKIIVATLIIAIAVVVFSDNRTSGEFVFIFAPLAIITSNYIESIDEKWFKDVFIATLVLAPLVISFL